MQETINFSIPGFRTFSSPEYEILNKFIINLKFINFVKNNPNLFRENICISHIYDSFPGMIWEGGRYFPKASCATMSINNIKEIIDIINNHYNTGIKLVCSNLLLEEKHLEDKYCNEILSLLSLNKKNSVIVGSELLMKYIKQYYPNLSIGLSTTRGIYEISEINNLLNEYDFIVPDFKFNNNFNNINFINTPSKLELVLNETCDPSCDCRYKHYELFSKKILNEEIQITDCTFPKYKNMNIEELVQFNPKVINVNDIYTNYFFNNITSFKIMGRDYPPSFVLQCYMYYMSKPEKYNNNLNIFFNEGINEPIF